MEKIEGQKIKGITLYISGSFHKDFVVGKACFGSDINGSALMVIGIEIAEPMVVIVKVAGQSVRPNGQRTHYFRGIPFQVWYETQEGTPSC